MRRALLYSFVAHALAAAVFRVLVYFQENPLDAREVQLEFSVSTVKPRAAAAAPPPRNVHPDGRTTTDDPLAQDTQASDGDTGKTDDQFVPVGRTGRGPRWISGHITRADYPPAASREGIEATVRAMVFVRRDGSVYRVRIIDGHPAFDDTVIRKLKAAVFSPALDRESGRPIAVRMILPIEFRLR